MAWTSRSRVGRADGVVEGSVDGLLIVLQPATGEYAGLDGTAVRIWELLAQPQTFGHLVETLAAEHQAPRGECAPEIAQCLEGLRRQGLVGLSTD
jgi:Coenzyme PQQ synthesis protein D (PqqD)